MPLSRLASFVRRWMPAPGAIEGPRALGGIDVPIETASQDRLRRSPLVNRVAEVLGDGPVPVGRVFAIRGAWGAGKSSFKNLIAERLAARVDPPLQLQFNPWQWRDADAISRALYLEIADRLGTGWSRKASRRASRLRRYGAVLTGAGASAGKVPESGAATVLGSSAVVAMAASVGLGLPSAAFVAGALATGAIALTVGGKLLTVLGRDRGGEPLEDVRRDLESSLRELTRPLIVFVDDIDRLEPEEIREVLRQVKANGGLPNIVFVLLFQPSIVEAALDPIANGDGRSFLEKIVHTNFDLPATPRSAVHRIMTEELTGIAGGHATPANGFEEVRWGNVLVGCIQPRIGNLRDARRYLSSVAAHLPLQSDAAFEVNIVDFLGIEALRVFEPALHARIFAERELLLQTGRFRQDGRDAEQRTRVEALLATGSVAGRAASSDTLSELFPTIEWALGGTHYGEGFHQRWINAKRICTSRYFGRYFELQTAEGEVSESEFSEFIANSGNAGRLQAMVASLEERGLLGSLAARLDESVERLPAADAATLLPVMFALGQTLVSTRATGSFDSPWVAAWRSVSWYLRSAPAAERGGLALDALRATGALLVAAMLIHLNDPADRDAGEREGFVPDFPAADLAALKVEWLAQLSVLAADPPQLLARPDLASLLYRWRDYEGSFDPPRQWIGEAAQGDLGFATIVSAFMSRGTSQGFGDRVAARHDTFRRDTVDEMIGVDEARRRIADVDRTALPEELRYPLDVLDRHLAQWAGAASDD